MAREGAGGGVGPCRGDGSLSEDRAWRPDYLVLRPSPARRSRPRSSAGKTNQINLRGPRAPSASLPNVERIRGAVARGGRSPSACNVQAFAALGEVRLAEATLTISSKNYSSWSLRGWLLVKFSGLDFTEAVLPVTDVEARAELLILSPSMLVPCLRHDGHTIWNNLAIGEYLAEIRPRGGAAAGRPRAAHAVPLDLRRDAFRLRLDALGAADEPARRLSQLPRLVAGAIRYRAHRHDLARVPRRLRRPVPDGCRAHHGRRHVRAGVHPLQDLPRERRRGLSDLLRHDPGAARDDRVDRRPRWPSRSRSRNSRWSSSALSRRSAARTARRGWPTPATRCARAPWRA